MNNVYNNFANPQQTKQNDTSKKSILYHYSEVEVSYQLPGPNASKCYVILDLKSIWTSTCTPFYLDNTKPGTHATCKGKGWNHCVKVGLNFHINQILQSNEIQTYQISNQKFYHHAASVCGGMDHMDPIEHFQWMQHHPVSHSTGIIFLLGTNRPPHPNFADAKQNTTRIHKPQHMDHTHAKVRHDREGPLGVHLRVGSCWPVSVWQFDASKSNMN